MSQPTLQPILPVPKSLTALDDFGTVAFAFSGTLTAAKSDMGVIGATLLATIVAIGGGTMRDVLLGASNGNPAFWIRPGQPKVFRMIIFTCFATLLAWPTFAQSLHVNDTAWAFSFFDAIGLAAFTTVGARKGVESGVPPEASVLCGFLTACGGGIIRDVIIDNPPRALYAGRSAYATPAVFGAAVYVAIRGTVLDENQALWMGFAAALVTRVCAFTFRLKPIKATGLREKEWEAFRGIN